MRGHSCLQNNVKWEVLSNYRFFPKPISQVSLTGLPSFIHRHLVLLLYIHLYTQSKEHQSQSMGMGRYQL